MTSQNRRLVAGVLLVAVQLIVVTFPDRLQAVIEFVGGTYQVILPWGICIAIATYALAMLRLSSGSSTSDVLPHAVATGIAVHIILLLADYTHVLTARSTFTTGAYWMYARAFCSASLAVLIVWIDRRRRASAAPRERELSAFALPVAVASALYAVALLRSDWLACVLGAFGGVALAAGADAGREAFDRVWPRPEQRDRLFLLATFFAALALRLFYVSRIMTNPDFIETGGDGLFYDRIAVSLVQGHGTAVVADGYPLYLLGYPRFLALVYLVAGHSYFAACVVQAVLSALTCLIVYAIARPIFGRPAAKVTAVFTAISFQLIFTAASYGHEALDVFLTPLAVWLLIRAVERRSGYVAWLAIGLVLGAGIAVRETQVVFLLFVLAWVPFAIGSQHRVRRTIESAGLLGLGTALVVLPILLPKIATADDRAYLRKHLDRLWINPITEEPAARPLVSPFTNPTAAVQQLRQDPYLVATTAVRGMVVNFSTQFFTQPYGGFDLVSLTKHSAYYYGIWFWAYVLTLLGLLIAVGRWWRADPRALGIALIIGLLLSRTAPHLILESHYRHRAPIEAFLIMLASVGAVRLFGARPSPSPEPAL